MNQNRERINELKTMIAANSRRNNEIFQKTDRIDQNLLCDNILMRDELGKLTSAKNMDVSALA